MGGQHLGGGIIIAGRITQVNLGQLRRQVSQALPVGAGGAGLAEIVGGPGLQRRSCWFKGEALQRMMPTRRC